jgi:hypothetical protein
MRGYEQRRCPQFPKLCTLIYPGDKEVRESRPGQHKVATLEKRNFPVTDFSGRLGSSHIAHLRQSVDPTCIAIDVNHAGGRRSNGNLLEKDPVASR